MEARDGLKDADGSSNIRRISKLVVHAIVILTQNRGQ